jgi:hypothetical protein
MAAVCPKLSPNWFPSDWQQLLDAVDELEYDIVGTPSSWLLIIPADAVDQPGFGLPADLLPTDVRGRPVEVAAFPGWSEADVFGELMAQNPQRALVPVLAVDALAPSDVVVILGNAPKEELLAAAAGAQLGDADRVLIALAIDPSIANGLEAVVDKSVAARDDRSAARLEVSDVAVDEMPQLIDADAAVVDLLAGMTFAEAAELADLLGS